MAQSGHIASLHCRRHGRCAHIAILYGSRYLSFPLRSAIYNDMEQQYIQQWQLHVNC